MEMPTRDELLAIVRKHSASLPDVQHRVNDVDMRFWREMLDMFFVRGRKSAHDDLLFFVNRAVSLRYVSEVEQERSPYFVRRWNLELGKVIGDNSSLVDWQQSFYLNLIAHTTYTLTVAVCSVEALQKRRSSTEVPWNPLYEVTKRVYASPSRTNVLSKSSKAFETVPSYPDIYFAVDDFDDTFQNLILTDDHCYCVLLHASGGAAFGSKTPARTSKQSAFLHTALFSGFVKYDVVRADFESHGMFGLLPKSQEMTMRGPGGHGQVEVILSRVIDGESLSSPSDGRLGIGSIVRKAASVARHAYLAASSGSQSADTLSLRCCLTSLSLPWNTLARDLLFKH